jgi:integrase/recombinase XerD
MFEQTLTRTLVPAPGPSEGALIPDIQEGIESYAQFSISRLLRYFSIYARHEWGLAPQTIELYVRNLTSLIRILGDLKPQQIAPSHVFEIKSRMVLCGAGPSRTISLIASLKTFLRFCREALDIQTIDPKGFCGPRLRRREVLFLESREVRQFVRSILRPNAHLKLDDLDRLCFRTLVEVILGSGMRLSEALSLKRSLVNFETGEARIIGKGNKERTVFFTVRALRWLREYLSRRPDALDDVFLSAWGRPMQRHTAILWFRWFRHASGIKKKFTAHTLRHTVATTLLFNGCPIGHVKEILGHERLQTTCTYYLGTDKRAAKAAYFRCLRYDTTIKTDSGSPAL